MFESLYLLSLTSGLILKSTIFLLFHSNLTVLVLTLNILLFLKLLEEFLVAHENAVRVRLFLALTGQQFR